MAGDFQALITEACLFREEMRATRGQLELLNGAMSKLFERVEACESRIDLLCTRVDKQECLLSEKIIKKSRDAPLLAAIEQLKSELNDRDQELLLNDVEFSCIPEQKGENPLHIILSLANKLGVSLMEQDIVSCLRLGRPPEPAMEQDSTTCPRLILVRLARRVLRDQLLKAARVRRGANTEGVGLPDPPRRFYVNERLTKINRQLIWKVRECTHRFDWRFVWTKGGKVYVRQRQDEGSPRYRICTTTDLVRVFVADYVSPPESSQNN